jgi:hypothetical protein
MEGSLMGAGRAIKAQQSKSDIKQTRRVARTSNDRVGTTSTTKVATKAVKPEAKQERKRVPSPPVADPIPEPESNIVARNEQLAAAVEPIEMKSDVVNAITWDDPKLDRRIIEGMLTDRNALVDELSTKGITAAAVVRRAADLGLSEAYLRHVQTVAADLAGDRPGARRVPSSLAARDCLSCNRVFLSSGPGNRICPRCRGADAGLAQL